MKKLLTACAVTVTTVAAICAKAPKDPVVMTIDDENVTLGEFEYLYNKNNSQQIEPMTFDEYIDLFTNYKLKVADAKACGIDTTPNFKLEFNKYRMELARPFLRDKATEEALIQEAYSHAGEEVYVSHIMIDMRNPNAEHLADSLYNAITSGALSYEEVAVAHSIDKNSAAKGGRMGWVTGDNRFPWAFEKGAFDTPVGEVSRPINSGYGLHLIRPEERRPARGQVHTRHILLNTRDIDPELVEKRRQRIDSIYNALVGGADFAELAARYSQDPGSAQNGGDLGWYGPGRMVEPFDSISFALADGEISKPFTSPYGFHIIQKLGSQGVQPLDSLRPAILQAMERDGRDKLPVQAMIDRTAERTGSKILDGYKPRIREIVRSVGGMTDSTALAQIRAIDIPACNISGQEVPLSEVLTGKMLLLGAPYDVVVSNIDRFVQEYFNEKITDIEIAELEVTDPEFRNLIREYRDGIMLFEIANQKVWDKAAKDKEGMEQYFQQNREKYTNWERPKYKAYVVFASDSATIDEAKAYIDSAYHGGTMLTIPKDAFTKDLREKFPQRVKVERVIAAQGENPITDYLGFGGPMPEKFGVNWKGFFAVAGEVIEQPEEALDVKGLVLTDYQNALEKAWLEELRRTHKVTINQKAIKKARK